MLEFANSFLVDVSKGTTAFYYSSYLYHCHESHTYRLQLLQPGDGNKGKWGGACGCTSR